MIVFAGLARSIDQGQRGIRLYVSAADGGELRPLRGTLLASRLTGRGPWKVVEIDLATGKTDVLLRRAADPVYSPDGTRIAFIRWRRLGPHEGIGGWASNVFTIKAGGGGLRQITDSPWEDYSQSWDSSGERLAFVRYPPELEELGYGSAVMQINADGTCLSTVLPASLDTAFFGVAWQPGVDRAAGRIDC